MPIDARLPVAYARWSCCVALADGGRSRRRSAQVGYDRPGGDYTSFALRSGDPAQCAARCERDSRCRAWALLLSGDRDRQCPLLAQVAGDCRGWPTPAACRACAGPADRAERRPDRILDRPRRRRLPAFDLPPDPTGKTCQAACEGEEGCRAWTYLRPGYGGPAAACYLKDRITRPQRRPCCGRAM